MILTPLLLGLSLFQGPLPDLEARRGPERIFEVVKTLGSRKFVKARRSGATAWIALKELEDLGAFKLNLELPELRSLLEGTSLNLSLDSKDALSVAELITVAAGLDLVVTKSKVEGADPPFRWIATIANPPSERTEAGREVLRRWAIRWYRNLLTSELRANRETADAETRVHIDLALLMIEQGNLAGASEEFRLFRRLAPGHPYVPHALLHEARCQYDMGRWRTAIERAREVMTENRSSELGIQAAILLGRAYLAMVEDEKRKGRSRQALVLLDEMVHRLTLFGQGFRDRKEYPRLLVLIGTGQLLRKRPDQALVAARAAAEIQDPFLMPKDLWADYSFLRGSAEIEAGEPVFGERVLWQFLAKVGKDPRAGVAWLRISKAELVAGDPLQGLFAARKALETKNVLSPEERFAALVLESQGLLGVGMIEQALDGLERRVKEYGPERVPALALHLSGVLLDEGRPERAKRILSVLAGLPGLQGDRARMLLVEAEAKQGNDQRVIELVRSMAPDIRDEDIQTRLAELLGDAYLRVGEPALAAQAFNGRIL